MEVNIFDYVKEDEYNRIITELKANEIKLIYSDENIDIEIRKVGRKIYIFTNKYGKKSLNEALNNVCSLV